MENEVFNQLKVKLKEQGMTYKDLANKLELSEVSIKRIFSQKNCSLKQFHQICQACNLSPDLLYADYSHEKKILVIEGELEDYFLNNMSCFYFYRQLTFLPDLKILKKNLKLTQNSINYYLLQLRELGLINIGQNKKIEFNYSKVIELPKNGRIRDVLQETWIPYFIEKIKNHEKEKGHFLETFTVSLSKSSSLLYQKKLIDLKEEMFIQAERDKKRMKKDQGVSFLFGMGPYRMALDGEVENI